MRKPIYGVIGAGVVLALVWVFAQQQDSEHAATAPEQSMASLTASPSASLDDSASADRATSVDGVPKSPSTFGDSPAPPVPNAAAVPAAASSTMPIDVSPGFEFLSKPASEMKDTDHEWSLWRRHQKLDREPRDESWAPRIEAALRNGIEAALTAKRLDTQRIELPVIECRTNGCEIQAIGYPEDSAHGGYDFQQALGSILMGPLGSEFNLNETIGRVTNRTDNRTTFLTHLTRRST